ncbi:major capsid protein [Streptomyces sp. NPDC058691]|uniref:major capsid protein n=1 Tax=Streptomyces sp. NPDC058691 TaxID=3346601 RepID=UPI0036657417
MAAEFELPEDLTALTDDELSEALDGARAAFDALSSADNVTPDGLVRMRELAGDVEAIRTEQAARAQAAEEAAAEIESLAAQIRGDDGGEEPEPATAAVEPAAPAAPAEPAPAPAPAAPAQTASGARRTLNLSGVRQRQPRVLPELPAPRTSITAAVDVPGYTPGSPLQFDQITAGIISRANALKTAGGGVGQVISYRHPYPAEAIVTDPGCAIGGYAGGVALRRWARFDEQFWDSMDGYATCDT